MSDKAFKVQFICENCGNEWEEEFREGTRVINKGIGRKRIKSKCEDYDFSHISRDCDECRTIECEVCGISEKVTINNRSPI